MKKALLAVVLFVFCSVSYSKSLYDNYTPPETIEQAQCMAVTLALTNKYRKQVESLFDREKSISDFMSYAWGVHQVWCEATIAKTKLLHGQVLEETIKNTIKDNALQYRGFFKKIAEEVMRRYEEQRR